MAEKEIGEIAPFTIATNIVKYIGVNLIKQAKQLYYKSFKSLKNEIGVAIRIWKNLWFSCIISINIVKNGHITKIN